VLGRLAFSQACRDISDLARALSTYADGHPRSRRRPARSRGPIAVVAERLRGASWAQIVVALGVTRQSAHERYAPFERRTPG
jgi:hypothetical protein